MSTIVVPLDGSQRAEQALPLAARLAERGGTMLTLVRVVSFEVDSDLLDPVDESPSRLEGNPDELEDARAYLYAVSRRLRRQGIDVSWEVRSGRPSDEIVRVAETTPTDLIVMATHGRSGIMRWVMGSVTEQVLRTSTVPVVVIPAPALERRLRHGVETTAAASTDRA